jgi:hypothetical protein
MLLRIFGVFGLGVFLPMTWQAHRSGTSVQWIAQGRRQPEPSPRQQAGDADEIFEEMPKNSGHAAEK